jgi:hypothetical protein
MWASGDGHQEIVAVLLEHRAQVNLVDEVRQVMQNRGIMSTHHKL